jgi:hypothetical protein
MDTSAAALAISIINVAGVGISVWIKQQIRADMAALRQEMQDRGDGRYPQKELCDARMGGLDRRITVLEQKCG